MAPRLALGRAMIPGAQEVRMPRVSTLALFALALVGLASPAEARFGTQDCYSYLTMRQVQTRDYSYEVRQNCEILRRRVRRQETAHELLRQQEQGRRLARHQVRENGARARALPAEDPDMAAE